MIILNQTQYIQMSLGLCLSGLTTILLTVMFGWHVFATITLSGSQFIAALIVIIHSICNRG